MPARLPASLVEVRAATRIAGSAEPVTGRRASEARVGRALSNAGAVHVATHASLNARSPIFSRIDLAPGRGGPRAYTVSGGGVRS